MLEMICYIDANKIDAPVIFAKKEVIDDSLIDENLDYDDEYHNINTSRYFEAYTSEDKSYCIDNSEAILYRFVHNSSIKINIHNGININKIIADIYNKLFDSPIDNDIDIQILIRNNFLDTYEDILVIDGYNDEKNLIRIDIVNNNNYNINLEQIYYYLNDKVKYRVKFSEKHFNLVTSYILPINNDELKNILLRFYIINRSILI